MHCANSRDPANKLKDHLGMKTQIYQRLCQKLFLVSAETETWPMTDTGSFGRNCSRNLSDGRPHTKAVD